MEGTQQQIGRAEGGGKPPPDDVEKLVGYIALLVEALRQQRPDEGAGKTSWWRYCAEPVVLTSIITVVLGGLVGGIITAMYQDKLKQREEQQTTMRARADQAMLWYKDYLTQEQEVIRRYYGEIGGCVSISARLISQT